MKKSALFTASICVFALALTTSCKKKEVDKDTQSSIDYTLAEAGYSGVLPVINQIGIEEDGLNKASSCATVTIESGDTTDFPNNGPVTLKLDYGSTGCEDYDGRVKKGVMYTTFTDKWSNQGATVNVSFEDYNVDGMNYHGTMDLTNNGNNSFSQTINDGRCETPTWIVLYSGTSTFDWSEGLHSPDDPADDEFHYTNNSEGTNRNGEAFTITTDAPIVKRNDCKFIQSGILNITPESKATRTFDFGDNTCDEFATVTINGNTFEFEMN